MDDMHGRCSNSETSGRAKNPDHYLSHRKTAVNKVKKLHKSCKPNLKVTEIKLNLMRLIASKSDTKNCINLMSHRTRWETPRGRYDEHSSKFSLSMKPKFNRPVGERNHFWRLLRADFGRAHYRCQQQRGTCTQHNQTTLPQLTVRLSISLVLQKTKD
jgi:hypothetical protein